MATLARRDAPASDAELLEGLRDRYRVVATKLVLLGGGLDAAAWTYRVSVRSRPDLVLKVTLGEPRPAAYLVPRHLHDAGAGAVVAPMPTTDQRLYVQAHGLTCALYPFAAGYDGWSPGMSDRHWYNLGSAVRAVHDVTLDPWLTELAPRDDPTAEKYDALTEWDAAVHRPTAAVSPFARTWNRNRETMHAMREQMRRLVQPLGDRPRQDVVCHGDLHPGNVLIDHDRVHIIDWDDVLLAPRERDFIFVPHQGVTGDANSPRCRPAPTPLAASFLQGYHLPAAGIDWVALTYYRCERVVQDVIAFADQALGATASDIDAEEANRWMRHIFAPDGEAAAASAAACHLPADLDVLNQG